MKTCGGGVCGYIFATAYFKVRGGQKTLTLLSINSVTQQRVENDAFLFVVLYFCFCFTLL
jgi:hypothetical protein